MFDYLDSSFEVLDMNTVNRRENDIYFNSKEGYYVKSTLNDESSHFLVNNTTEACLAPLRVVECSLQFLQIGEVDTMNERFQAVVLIKAKWYESDKITDYDPKKYWNPKLYIENASYDKLIGK